MMNVALSHDEPKAAVGLSAADKKWLTALPGLRVKFDVPMRRYTTLAVGGPADALVMPTDINTLTKVLSRAGERGIPWMIIGGGSNLLVQDGGIRGVVLTLTPYFKGIAVVDTDSQQVGVTAKAGTRLQTLCRYTIEQGLSGMTFALGIPGSLGGAIAMNAGTAHGCLADVLEAITVLWPTGQIERIERSDLDFSYRRLLLPTPASGLDPHQGVVIEGAFTFPRTDARQLEIAAQAIKAEREKRQPTGARSAGCFFKNPPSGPSAGGLIDRAGLKGTRRGDAEVSTRHGNFIINRGNARAVDILALADMVAKQVARQFGIQLEREVIITGESNHAS